ncbi:MAG: hypothetical protein WA821_12920 [Anaerolineales bacterium]
MPSLLQILFLVFDFVFDFWPVLLLAPLQNRKNGIRSMVYAWVFWAIIRIVLFFNPEPIKASMLIPEPLSTTLFFVTGFVLIIIWRGVNYWKSGRMRSKKPIR